MARAAANARRYAEAAFEIAQRDENVELWLAQLERVGAALEDAGTLRSLENPNIPLEERQKALDALFESGMLPQLRNMIGLVLRRRRLEALPSIAREFRRLYNRQSGIVEATATSAAELDQREVDALRERLERFTGGTIQLDLRVDPQLLGGVQVRVGDLLIDGSVRGRLERLRNRLAAGTLTS